MYSNLTLRRVLTIIVGAEKQYCVCVCVCVCVWVALVILHAKRMRHTVMWPAPLYNSFPHYLINGMTLGEKKIIE